MVGKDGVQGSGLKVTIKKLYQQKKKKRRTPQKQDQEVFSLIQLEEMGLRENKERNGGKVNQDSSSLVLSSVGLHI